MALDRAVLGSCAAEQMEALEQAFGDDESVEIGAVITIVEVVKEDADTVSSSVRMRFNVADPYRVLGLLRAAEQNILSSFSG
jgi:hypothetical protein